MMTSRERVLCALNHEEPDRVPVFFGTSGATTMLAPAYERLKAHLGLSVPTRLMSRAMQYARIDESVLERFGSDGRMLTPGAVPSPLRPPSGCRFHPRCPQAQPACSAARPPLCSLGSDREVACVLYGAGGGA